MNNIERNRLFNLLDIVSELIKYPSHSWTSLERKTMAEAIGYTGFYQKLFTSRKDIQKFSNLIEEHIASEIFDRGTIIQEEMEDSNKILFIIKGKVKRYMHKTINEIRMELGEDEIDEVSSSSSNDSPLNKKRVNNVHSKLLKGSNLSHILNSEFSASRKWDDTTLLSDNLNANDQTQVFKLDSKIKNQYKYTKIKKIANNEDDELLREIARKNPNDEERFIRDSICRYKKTDEYGPGSYAGEECLTSNYIRRNLLIASDKTYCLALSKEDLERSMKETQDARVRRIEFITRTFPNMEEDIYLFFDYFDEYQFGKEETIYEENDTPDSLYFLIQGDIKLLNTSFSEYDRSNLSKSLSKREQLFCIISKPQFFGEELLIGSETRMFTAISGPTGALCYVIKKNTFLEIKPLFRDIINQLMYQAIRETTQRERATLKASEPEIHESNIGEILTTPRQSKVSANNYEKKLPPIKPIKNHHGPLQFTMRTRNSSLPSLPKDLRLDDLITEEDPITARLKFHPIFQKVKSPLQIVTPITTKVYLKPTYRGKLPDFQKLFDLNISTSSPKPSLGSPKLFYNENIVKIGEKKKNRILPKINKSVDSMPTLPTELLHTIKLISKK